MPACGDEERASVRRTGRLKKEKVDRQSSLQVEPGADGTLGSFGGAFSLSAPSGDRSLESDMIPLLRELDLILDMILLVLEQQWSAVSGTPAVSVVELTREWPAAPFASSDSPRCT